MIETFFYGSFTSIYETIFPSKRQQIYLLTKNNYRFLLNFVNSANLVVKKKRNSQNGLQCNYISERNNKMRNAGRKS